MKLLKRLLSGVMALAMAASMTLSTAVQAGAELKNDGKHEFEMNASVASWAMFFPQNSFAFLWLDAKEIETLKKADAKGFARTSVKFYRDDKNNVEFVTLYNNGKWNYVNTYVNDESLSKEMKVYLSVGEDGESRSLTYLTDMDDTIFEQYKNAPYRYWSITCYGDDGSQLDEYSFGTNVPAKGSKTLSGIVTVQNTTKDISTLSFSKISNKTYTGKESKPTVTVKDGNKKLTEGTDYTLSYNNNKKIGKASVTIKGKGNYTGEKTIEFKIVPKKTTLKVSKKSETKAVLNWKAVKGAEKYEIYYSKDGGKTYKKFKTVSGKETSYTSTKLDFKKYDYKFKIRSYGISDGKKYYSSYSKVVTVK